MQSDYENMIALAGQHKPIALAEVGTLPSLETLARQPRWTYMMVWSEFAEDHNTPAQLQSIFRAPTVFSRGDPRLHAAPPTVPATAVPRNLHATPAARALLASLFTSQLRVTEVDLAGATPQTLAADLRRLKQEGKVPLLRWSPPSPTGDNLKPLDDFEWSELRRPGSPLHASWLAQLDALGLLLQPAEEVAVLFSPLPGANGSAWWSRSGQEGSQALLREVQQRLAARSLNGMLWVWEPSADGPSGAQASDAPPAAKLEAFFPGPLGIDAFVLDTSSDPATRDGTLLALREMAAGRPVGLRATTDSPEGSIPYDFRVAPNPPEPDVRR